MNTDYSYLKCINCGSTTDLLAERGFRCACGGLYDVMHPNLPSKPSPNDRWHQRADIEVFDMRAKAKLGPESPPVFTSGVWRFQEWVMPDLEQRQIVTLGEGNVPIVPAGPHLRNWLGHENVWLILEGETPTGSFKDFGMTVLVSVAKKAGIPSLICSSTGDTSASLAAYAAKAGIPCAVILPKGQVTSAQLAQPLVHGAKVINLPTDFDGCMAICQELVAMGAYPGNSLNPARIEGHQATVFLTAQFFGWNMPDWYVVPGGNGSNGSSVGKAIRLLRNITGQRSRLMVCQSAAANPLARSFHRAVRLRDQWAGSLYDHWANCYRSMQVKKQTTATAAKIGNPVSAQKIIREVTASEGWLETATERDLNYAVQLCGRDGYFVCPQTGMALAGLRRAIQRGVVSQKERIMVVSTATGLKFTDAAAAHAKTPMIDLSPRECNARSVAKILGM